jgi:hypothetical protein
VGTQALLKATNSGNTAVGHQTLTNLGNGLNNTALGHLALFNCSGASTGNIGIGEGAGFNLTTGSNDIDIGNVGVAGEGNTMRLGTTGTLGQSNTYIAGISGATVAGGIGVIVDSNGHLGTINSSARYKENIQPMDKTSEAILALQPVTFRYKKELDRQAIPQFGLVAEQVEKVDPDLVARDDQGKPYSVRYDAVNTMLLNEFLKEHKKVAEQEAAITQLKAELQATITRQQKQIEALTAGLQKVSAHLGLRKPAPGIVSNNP